MIRPGRQPRPDSACHSSDVLTRHERAAEIALASKYLDDIYRLHGCGACVHGISRWGMHTCKFRRKFPHCLNHDTGASFTPDHTKLRGKL